MHNFILLFRRLYAHSYTIIDMLHPRDLQFDKSSLSLDNRYC